MNIQQLDTWLCKDNTHTTWEWWDAPQEIRSQSPKEWNGEGLWIMCIDPGHGFPYTEFPVHNQPEWSVIQKQINDKWYVFIKDTRDIPWPPINIEDFSFGELAGNHLLTLNVRVHRNSKVK